jgi:uncharacterized protein involved in response to NO
MALWIAILSGALALPTRLDPVTWHAHEFLFGYLAAVMAGFMLTAVPNWTGRQPIAGWPLCGLLFFWVAGRIVIAFSAKLPPLAVAAIDLSMPLALIAIVAREIFAGRNWRNLIVLVFVIALVVGNAAFHWEAFAGGYPAGGFGIRIGLGAAVMLIALIGGRVVPNFTRNWLSMREGAPLPALTGKFDMFALLILLIATILWIAAPRAVVTGMALTGAGLIHVVRLGRWAGFKTGSEPLVWILHLAYAFVPLGAIVIGLSILTDGLIGARSAQHLWMAGAIGLMTLAIMTRATLGHTGRELHAGIGTVIIYLLIVSSIIARLIASFVPEMSQALYFLSGICWITGFGGFVIAYGPMLLSPRLAD